ncbi:MAG: PilZ domain-containing protein, partial [Candidatus Hydrogenedentota bacterium]
MMTLVFPGQSDPADQPEPPTSIRCEGAVVRCDPVQGSPGNQYEVAVFFTHMDDAAREAIEEYVKTHS